MSTPPAPASAPALRPLRLGEILDAAIKLTVRHFATFLAVVVITTGPLYFVVITLLAVTFPELLQIDPDPDSIATPEGDELSVLIGAGVVLGILLLAASLIATGACFQVVDDAWKGREPDHRRALRVAAPRIGSLLWISLLVTLGLFAVIAIPVAIGALAGPGTAVLGGLVGFGVAIWLGIRCSFAISALFGEDLRGVAAVRRSSELVSGRWWRTTGVLVVGLLLASVVSQVASLVVSLPPALIFAENPAVLAVSQFAGYLVGTVISTPAIAAVVVITYFDLRVRKEGYDLELRAASMGTSGPAGAVAAPGAGYVTEDRWTAEERAQAPFWPPPPGWQPERRSDTEASGLERGDEGDAPGSGLGR